MLWLISTHNDCENRVSRNFLSDPLEFQGSSGPAPDTRLRTLQARGCGYWWEAAGREKNKPDCVGSCLHFPVPPATRPVCTGVPWDQLWALGWRETVWSYWKSCLRGLLEGAACLQDSQRLREEKWGASLCVQGSLLKTTVRGSFDHLRNAKTFKLLLSSRREPQPDHISGCPCLFSLHLLQPQSGQKPEFASWEREDGCTARKWRQNLCAPPLLQASNPTGAREEASLSSDLSSYYYYCTQMNVLISQMRKWECSCDGK